jgi:hypothetical protein
MTLRFVPRARLWAQSPFFAAAVFALQRAVNSETPRLWEGPAGTAAPAGFCGQRVLRVADAPTRTDRYHARLARALSQLMSALQWPELQLVGLHRRAAWDSEALSGRAVYPPLARARDRLRAAELPSGFTGALVFGPQDCALVVPAWFWAARCDAAPSGLQVGAPGQRFTAALCQHGNLHLELYDEALMRRIDAAASACGLAPVQGICRNAFGASAAIAGRRLQA